MRKIAKKNGFIEENESKYKSRSLSVTSIPKTMQYPQSKELQIFQSKERNISFLNDEYISLNEDIFNTHNAIETKKDLNQIHDQIIKKQNFDIRKRQIIFDINSKNYQEVEIKREKIKKGNDSIMKQILKYQNQITEEYNELQLIYQIQNNSVDYETLMKLKFDVDVLDDCLKNQKIQYEKSVNKLNENKKVIEICNDEERQLNYLISTLNQKLTDLNDRIFNAKIKNESPITNIKPLSEFVVFLENEVKNCENKFSVLGQEIDELCYEIEQGTQKYQQLCTSASIKRKELDLKHDYIEKEKRMIFENDKLESPKPKKWKAKQMHNDRHPIIVGEICQTLNQHKNEYKQNNNQLKKYISHYPQSKEQSEQMLNDKRKRIEALIRKINLIDQLKFDISLEQDNLNKLEDKLYELNQNIKIFDDSKMRMNKLNENYQLEHNNIEEKRIQVSQEEKDLVKKKEQLDIKNKELLDKQSRLVLLEKELEEKEAQNNDLTNEILSLQKQLNNASLELERNLIFPS